MPCPGFNEVYRISAQKVAWGSACLPSLATPPQHFVFNRFFHQRPHFGQPESANAFAGPKSRTMSESTGKPSGCGARLRSEGEMIAMTRFSVPDRAHRFRNCLNARQLPFLVGLLFGAQLLACLPGGPSFEATGTGTNLQKDAGTTLDDAGFRADAGTPLEDAGLRADAASPDAAVGGGGANDSGMPADGAPSLPDDGGNAEENPDAGHIPAMDAGADVPSQMVDGGPAMEPADAGITCPDVICALACPEGFEEDSNGCPLCICAAERTFPDAGACPDVLCDLYCAGGFRQDENGCDICACEEVSCESTECPDNTHCEIRPATSARPEIPLCVEDEYPTCDLMCEEGQHCELQQVVCIQAPCPPIDVCVMDEELNGPHPVDCRELMCPPGSQCGTAPGGVLACVPHLDCGSVLCRDNMICRMTLADDGTSEVPICVFDPNATCDLTCETGHRCEIVETPCDGDICPPLDRCIPDEPALSCANLVCLEDHVCEMQEDETGHVTAVCVPQGSVCDLVICDVGWRCEEVVIDGQPEGRCVHSPPPPQCDLLCPPEQVCQLREAPCPEAECPLIPECVSRLPLTPLPGTCEQIRCAAGHRCVPGPLRAGLPTSYCVSIYAGYCLNDSDCDEVLCHAERLCLPPPSAAPGEPAAEVCYGLCLGETQFCESAEECGDNMACDLEACVPSSCNGDICTSDCRSICVQKDQIDCESSRYDCGVGTAE